MLILVDADFTGYQYHNYSPVVLVPRLVGVVGVDQLVGVGQEKELVLVTDILAPRLAVVALQIEIILKQERVCTYWIVLDIYCFENLVWN